MSMFCYQCQETSKNEGCAATGICGKSAEVAKAQDMVIDALRGLALVRECARTNGVPHAGHEAFVMDALFTTVTNVNFDAVSTWSFAEEALSRRDKLRARIIETVGDGALADLPAAANWTGSLNDIRVHAAQVGVLATEDEDLRSLRELLIYGVKGIAAYADHAAALGKRDETICDFIFEALAATAREKTINEMVALVLKAGEVAVTTMALLDDANTGTYGHPEATEVSLEAGDRPGILVSGHDLRDLEELLVQTEGAGIDVYTHGEMLPAHGYPLFKKFPHLIGNYGGAWFDQKKEFASFNGAILMTTNCIVPVQESYRDRIFTTGVVNYPEVPHVADRVNGAAKDFSAVIERARSCEAPEQIETGSVTVGFAHNQVSAVAGKVVDAVKSGAIKRFVVMAGCDGRSKKRQYFTDVAKQLPEDAVILTAGCAKYRYNKLDLGDIGGIPRVLDAGQCNDSYSLVLIALQLKEAFGLEHLNDLPLSFDIAWYEQKAVTVLLALLHLGVKGIRLGPTLPGFLSANVGKLLVETFDLKPIGDVASDVEAIMAGK